VFSRTCGAARRVSTVFPSGSTATTSAILPDFLPVIQISNGQIQVPPAPATSTRTEFPYSNSATPLLASSQTGEVPEGPGTSPLSGSTTTPVSQSSSIGLSGGNTHTDGLPGVPATTSVGQSGPTPLPQPTSIANTVSTSQSQSTGSSNGLPISDSQQSASQLQPTLQPQPTSNRCRRQEAHRYQRSRPC
jgi:hypothetical protein